jgi:hypothetical protein
MQSAMPSERVDSYSPSSRAPPTFQRDRAVNGVAVRALMALFLVLTAGCGGGVFLDIGIGDVGDQPPSVALTSAVAEAPSGAAVRLAAAASDDFGVDSVAFYREEGAGPPTLLATDGRPPYQLDTTIPVSAIGTVWRYYARAFDGAGQHADSALVEITVR